MEITFSKAPYYWVIPENGKEDKVIQLSREINLNRYLAGILVRRGIDSYQKAKRFFRPSLEDLHDPFLMASMDQAVQYLEKAIHEHQHIRLYGDYDVDGTTAVSLAFNILKHIHKGILSTYIPDRYNEGYGLSETGVDAAIQDKVDLMITLDCGIRSVAKVERLQSSGIDVIICDHHLPGDTLPPGVAILDPKRCDCSYPFKELSGCGVGFKLLQGLQQRGLLEKELLFSQLDLLAVSVGADIVPIIDENRVFTFFGLKKLEENPITGLNMLIKSGSLQPPFSVNNLVFGIAPRINAAGRMAHAKTVIDLLTADEERPEFVEIINTQNTQRRDVDQYITEEALKSLASRSDTAQRKTNVVYGEGWHKGVVGIVASRCMEYFYKPTIVLSLENGVATGSARSIEGFNIYEAIHACKDLLTKYGGHAHAAGLSLKQQHLQEFIDRFEEITLQTMGDVYSLPPLHLDSELPLEKINWKFQQILEQMKPFGPLNTNPVFVSRRLKVTEGPSILKEKHLKFNVRQRNSATFEVIAFQMAHKLDEINFNDFIDIAYHLEVNEWKDKRTLSFVAKDIKQSDDT